MIPMINGTMGQWDGGTGHRHGQRGIAQHAVIHVASLSTDMYRYVV